MSKVYTSVTELIGRTQLIELVNIEKKYDLKAKVVAKLELFNPAGSVKDRVARAMVEDAEKSGKLKKGSTIIEPTSGNTGIGLASVATAKGYKTILTMPETMRRRGRALPFVDSDMLEPREIAVNDSGSIGADERLPVRCCHIRIDIPLTTADYFARVVHRIDVPTRDVTLPVVRPSDGL